MPQVELTWGVATHTGQRSENQDRSLAAPPLFAVADGMGGHAAGGAASEAAVTALATAADGPTVGIPELRAALDSADQVIRALGSGDPERGAGTTVAGVGLVESGGELFWAAFHVGDSRIYRWSPTTWEQVSTDHSVVQELIDGGQISVAEAAEHPQRHVITRALGVGAPGEADFSLLPVEGGERFLLCSDGLTGELDEDRIGRLVGADLPPAEIADRLVAEAVAHGGRDNVTVVVVCAHPVAGADDGTDVEDITVPRLPGTAGPRP
ncbi:PP2C family protein-serine/threonine phosphatase [Blastococcus sp. SYSU D00820]